MNEADGSTAPESRDPVDLLTEEFLRRHRAGEAVEVEAFAAAHPEHADALRELLPTLLMLERMKRHEESSASGLGRPRVGVLQRLGDFRIVREIGRGGMGVVFEAVQEALGRRVALKVLPQSHLLTGHQLERFQREAQTAAKLHHSHIVPVFGCGEADGYHYYAMQFIDGHGLDRWMAELREHPPDAAALPAHCRKVARIGLEVAEALHYAHGQGTLHRDVKPSNLLLDRDGHVWVTDFGLAKALEQDGLTVSGDLLGTLQYMAPEQLRGLYDERSEVYALGLTLYELLCLRPAFAGRTRSELIEQIRNGRPERLPRLLPGMPRDLAVVVERAAARDSGDRYADAQQLAADLQRFLQDRPIQARPHTPQELLWRWCRQHRALAALTASTAAVVLLAAVFGWIMYGVTNDALARQHESTVKAQQEEALKSRNLELTLQTLEQVSDMVMGPDPFHAFEEDPETGEYSGVVRAVVDPRAAALMQTVLTCYDRFAAGNAGNAELQEQSARAYRRVGGIQFRLGDLAASERAYERALQLYQDVHQGDTHLQLASVLLDLGRALLADKDPRGAELRCREALRILDDGPGSRSQQYLAAQAHVLLLWTLFPGGETLADLPPQRGPTPGPRRAPVPLQQEVHAHLTVATQLLDQLQAGDADNPELLELRARMLRFMARPGATALERDDNPRAAQQQALAILRDLVARYPDADHYRFELVDTLLMAPGGRESGLAQLREALQSAQRLVALQPEVPTYRDALAQVQGELGHRLLGRATTRGAAAALRLLWSTAPTPAPSLPWLEEWLRDVVAGDAAALLTPALQRTRQLLPQHGDDRRLQLQAVQQRLDLARCLDRLDQPEDARVLASEVVAVLTDLMARRGRGGNEPLAAPGGGLGRLLGMRGGIAAGRGRPELVRLLDDLGMHDADSERLRARIAELQQSPPQPPPANPRGGNRGR